MDDLISRQAAIKAIEDLPNCYNGFSDTYDKAHIIGVLEELPSARPNLQPTCNKLATDCISRRAAIKATWEEPSYTDPLNVLTEVRDRLEALPSAQPTHNNESNVLESLDCVSRQAAIDALYGITAYKNQIPLFSAVFSIKKLPSAQRTGRWIIVTDSRGQHAECSYCGEWKYHSKQKFCGECGARMEEQE